MGHCVRGLYEDGRHYDLLMPGPNDLPFYESQVKKYGEPVLELACGTGRPTIPLRLAGTDITGLDNAPAMLQMARDKADSRDRQQCGRHIRDRASCRVRCIYRHKAQYSAHLRGHPPRRRLSRRAAGYP